MPNYDEVPRTSWILRYSAQATVVVTRTFFTQEVNEAFDELEEGNEDALKNEFERQVGAKGPRGMVPLLGGRSYMLLHSYRRACCMLLQEGKEWGADVRRAIAWRLATACR